MIVSRIMTDDVTDEDLCRAGRTTLKVALEELEKAVCALGQALDCEPKVGSSQPTSGENNSIIVALEDCMERLRVLRAQVNVYQLLVERIRHRIEI